MTEPNRTPPLPNPEYDSGTGSAIVRALMMGLGFILLIPLLPFSVRIVAEYERGVIFRLGRLVGAKGRDSSFSYRSSTGW